MHWVMGGVLGGVGFVLRRVVVHWVEVSIGAVIGAAGKQMLGLVRRVRLRVEVRRRVLA